MGRPQKRPRHQGMASINGNKQQKDDATNQEQKVIIYTTIF
jgi:hypothetical protein